MNKHQFDKNSNNSHQVGSSEAPAAGIKARDATITSFDLIRRRTEGSDTQKLHIPTKSEDCPPGPVLKPASCSSGIALMGAEVSEDMFSAESLAALRERMKGDLDKIRRLNSSLHNEEWDDFHPEDNHYQDGVSS